MICLVVVLYGSRRRICVRWCRVVSVGLIGDGVVEGEVGCEDDGEAEGGWWRALVTVAYDNGVGWGGWRFRGAEGMSGVGCWLTVQAKPPGSIAVVLVAEKKDTLPGSVAIVPGGRAGVRVDGGGRAAAGVVVVGTGVAIDETTRGWSHTPTAGGKKPLMDGWRWAPCLEHCCVTSGSRTGQGKFARITTSNTLR